MLVTDLLPIGMTALLVAIILVVVLDRTEVRNDRPRVLSLLLLRFFGLFWITTAAFLLFKIRIFFLHEPRGSVGCYEPCALQNHR